MSKLGSPSLLSSYTGLRFLSFFSFTSERDLNDLISRSAGDAGFFTLLGFRIFLMDLLLLEIWAERLCIF